MTNLRVAYVSTTGTATDATTGTVVKDTRIRAVQSTGIGVFTITGTSVDAFGNTVGNIIKFNNTTAADASYQEYPDNGIRMAGTVTVDLPVSAATVTIYYG